MVIWSDPAKSDLRHIFEYIAHDSTHYAKKVVQELVDKTDILSELPRIGRTVPEIGDENVRELPLYSYRIIYEIIADQVYVLAVAHKRRDIKPADIGK